jgi:uncharacterized protein YqjF (DUF2071 family)
MPCAEPPHSVGTTMVRQAWRAVGFVHWPVTPAVVAPLIPPSLEVDTFDGAAWISVTPFSTTCAVLGVAALPGPARFPETNVRTYVRGPDGGDGLFFLSLDVTNRANALLGRMANLPYHVASMEIKQQAGSYRYRGCRDGVSAPAAYDVRLRATSTPAADPLDVFLTGRWSAYVHYGPALLRYDVEHEPWPLRHATLVAADLQLAARGGAPLPSPADVTAHFAPGVSARIAPPKLVRARGGEVLCRDARGKHLLDRTLDRTPGSKGFP